MNKNQNDCLPLICIQPHDELFEAVHDNSYDVIERLITNNNTLLNHIYTNTHKNILQSACADLSEYVTPTTIRQLVNLGADLNATNVYEDRTPLHFAVLAPNLAVLQTIVDCLILCSGSDSINVTTTHGYTALNLLLKECKDLDAEVGSTLQERIDVLVKAKIDVNFPDNQQRPPIFWAIKNCPKVIGVLLRIKEIDVVTYKARAGKSCTDLIRDKKLWDGELPTYKYPGVPEIVYKIKNKSATKDDVMEAYRISDIYPNSTLLQQLVQTCQKDLVQALLSFGGDPNQVHHKNSSHPLTIAADLGDYQTMSVLLRDKRTVVPKTLLTQVLKNSDHTGGDGKDFRQCVSLVLKSSASRELVRHADDRGGYPLHYACQFGEENIVQEILEAGASLADRNSYGLLAVSDMDKKSLQKHLDSCLNIMGKRDENILCINYSSLLPSNNPNISSLEDVQYNFSKPISNHHEQETETMTSSQETFTTTEMDVPIFISESKDLRELLTHPVLATYIFLKWLRVSRYYFINLFFYSLLFSSLYLHTFLQYTNENYHNYSEGVKVFGVLVYLLNILGFVGLVLREIWQLSFAYLRYLKNVENYIEITIIVSMGLMLFYKPDPQADSTVMAKQTIAAIATLFSALELFLLIGQHPKLSTYIVMLRAVSKNFIKFLAFYSLPICAFALSFYILFSRVPEDPNDDPNFFIHPLTALVKIIIMLTGEFDAGTLKFESSPIISYILFVLFVFIIPMVLLNLLNGLAVTDTQRIKNDAELYSYITQIRHIAHIESMILAKNSSSALENCWRKFYHSAVQCCCKNAFIRQHSAGSDGSYKLFVKFEHGMKAEFEGDAETKEIIKGIDKNVLKTGKYIVEKNLADKKKHAAEKEERLQSERRIEKMLEDYYERINKLIAPEE